MRVGAERLGRVRAEPSVGHRIRDCFWTVSMFTLWQSLLESLCSTTGATQNSKGRHLVSVRWSHNTLCVCVCVIICVCVAKLMCFLYIIFFDPQKAARPLTCVLRRWTRLETCTGTVAKICLGSTGAVRTGEDRKHSDSYTPTDLRNLNNLMIPFLLFLPGMPSVGKSSV